MNRLVRIKKEIGKILFAAVLSSVIVFSQKVTIAAGIFSTYNEAYFETFSGVDFVKWLIFSCMIFGGLFGITKVLNKTTQHELVPRKKDRRLFIVWVAILMLVWLPCILTYYPGGIYSDTISSINMAGKQMPLTNHHPLLYTLYWRLILNIGTAMNLSMENIFFLFTCTMAVYMALAAAYFLYSCYMHGVSKIRLGTMTAYFALFNLIPLYIVSLWKDTPFAIITLAFSTFLLNIFWSKEEEEQLMSVKNIIGYILFGVLFSLLRNNGLYVFILLSLIIFIHFWRKDRKLAYKVGEIFLIITCCLLILRGPIYDHYGLNNDDKVESFGIPLQQVGYILSSDGNISEEDKAFLNNIIPLEKWKEVYCPLIVDRVKWDPEFNLSYLNEHSGEFLKLYVRVVAQNPIKAVKGYGLGTVGFWDPTKQARDAYLCNFMWPSLPFEMKDLVGEKLGVSLLKYYEPEYLFSSALFGWILLALTVLGISRHKDGGYIATIPSLGLWLTLLVATPIAFSLRYMFPLVLTIPVAYVTMIRPIEEGK